MLLNESQPRPPRISQHQQGAGDLQIKHSDYLCPPLTAPPPVTLLSITAHTKREGTHRTVVMIWGIKVFLFFVFPAELEGRVLHIPRLVLYHVIGRYPPELLNLWDCAIHKYKEQAGNDILITGVDYGTFYNAPASQEPLWSHGIPRSRSVIWASSNMRSELHDENPKQITHSSKAPV